MLNFECSVHGEHFLQRSVEHRVDKCAFEVVAVGCIDASLHDVFTRAVVVSDDLSFDILEQ